MTGCGGQDRQGQSVHKVEASQEQTHPGDSEEKGSKAEVRRLRLFCWQVKGRQNFNDLSDVGYSKAPEQSWLRHDCGECGPW